MSRKGGEVMRAFMPSDPSDKQRSQIETMNWRAELEEKRAKEKMETRRFIITTVIASVAASAAIVAAVASVIACLQ